MDAAVAWPSDSGRSCLRGPAALRSVRVQEASGFDGSPPPRPPPDWPVPSLEPCGRDLTPALDAEDPLDSEAFKTDPSAGWRTEGAQAIPMGPGDDGVESSRLIGRRAVLLLGGAGTLAACTSGSPSLPATVTSSGDGTPASRSSATATSSGRASSATGASGSGSLPAPSLPVAPPWAPNAADVQPQVKAAAVQVVQAVLGYRAGGAGLARLVSGGLAGTGPGTRSCVRQGWWRRPRAQRLR